MRGGVRGLGRVHRQPRPVSRLSGTACRPASDHRRPGDGHRRQGEAALPPDWGASQRRDGPARDADGAGVPAGRRELAACHPDPVERHRLDHAGGGTGRPRPLRRLVLRVQDRGDGRRRLVRRPAVLGQVHPSRQQSGLQLLAADDARHPGLVPPVAPADHARAARVGAVPLHLQRPGSAESRRSTRFSTASCRGSRTSRWPR